MSSTNIINYRFIPYSKIQTVKSIQTAVCTLYGRATPPSLPARISHPPPWSSSQLITVSTTALDKSTVEAGSARWKVLESTWLILMQLLIIGHITMKRLAQNAKQDRGMRHSLANWDMWSPHERMFQMVLCNTDRPGVRCLCLQTCPR